VIAVASCVAVVFVVVVAITVVVIGIIFVATRTAVVVGIAFVTVFLVAAAAATTVAFIGGAGQGRRGRLGHGRSVGVDQIASSYRIGFSKTPRQQARSTAGCNGFLTQQHVLLLLPVAKSRGGDFVTVVVLVVTIMVRLSWPLPWALV